MPSNDDFANATLLSAAGGTTQDDNTGATSDGINDPLVTIDGYGPESIWYKIAPAAFARSLYLDTDVPTSGTPIGDSVVGVYIGTTLAGLIKQALNDDGGPGFYSKVNAHIPATETCYVEICGFSTDQGAFTLNWSLPPAPANDNIADAEELLGTSDTVSGTNVGASMELDEEDAWYGNGPLTVWYRWHNNTGFPQEFTINNATCGAGFDPDGIEIDIFSTTVSGAVASFTDMYSGFTGFVYIYSDHSVTERIINVPNGDSLFINVFDYSYDSLQDVFTFDWSVVEIPPPPMVSLSFRQGI